MDCDFLTVPALCDALSGMAILVELLPLLLVLLWRCRLLLLGEEEKLTDEGAAMAVLVDRRLDFSLPIATAGDRAGKLDGGPYRSMSLFWRRMAILLGDLSVVAVVFELDGHGIIFGFDRG